MAEASDHPYSIVMVLRLFGMVLLHHGQMPRAIAMFERVLTVCETSNLPGFVPWCLRV
jgi:hypothetical protein